MRCLGATLTGGHISRAMHCFLTGKTGNAHFVGNSSMCWSGKPEISAAGSSMLFHLALFLSRSTNVHQGAWGILSECHRIVWMVIFSNGCRGRRSQPAFSCRDLLAPPDWKSQTSEIAMAHGDMWAMAQWSRIMHHLAEYAEGLCSVFDCPLAWNRFTSFYIGMSAVACCSFFGPYSIRRYIILCRDINIYIYI